jgi:methionyl-tRNA formyltransferase
MAIQLSAVFLGSGPVAAESLRLLQKHVLIEAVITKASTEDMLRSAAPQDTPVLIANNKRELDAVNGEHQFTSPVGIVIDYGVIISPMVINSFPKGIINSHFSLLPELRGADPITFAILSGAARTGVSLMLIDEGLDTGDLLAQSPYELTSDITTPELTEHLIELSDHMLREILPQYLAGDIVPVDQLSASIVDDKAPTYSRKLTKDDGLLDPNKSAVQLEREIRAFAEWPKTRMQIGNKDVVITSSRVSDLQIGGLGYIAQKDKRLLIQTVDGTLDILTLKPASKKEMTAEGFLAGYGHLVPKL